MSTHGEYDLWSELQDAAEIREPSDSDFGDQWARYQRRTSPLKAVSARARGRRPVWLAAAAVAAAAVCVAVLPTLGGNDPRRDAPPAAQSSSRTGETSASPKVATTIQQSAQATGSQVGYFAAPTFAEFTHTAFVDDVIIGTVLSSTSEYVHSGDDGTVYTHLTIKVQHGRSSSRGSTITVWQPGGTVRKGEMKDYFKDPVPAAEQDDLVEFVIDETPVAKEGATVLAAIGAEKGPYASIARVVLPQSADGSGFVWAGKAPNPDWTPVVTAGDARELTSP